MEHQIIYSSILHNKSRDLFSVKKILLLISILVVITGAGFAYYLYNKPHQSIADETPAFVMDANILIGEYDANEKNANAKYLGKIVEVKGIIAEKSKDSKGNFNVTLQGPDLAGIGCEFELNAQVSVAKLKEGQEVKIKGICTGVLMDVVMVDCVCTIE